MPKERPRNAQPKRRRTGLSGLRIAQVRGAPWWPCRGSEGEQEDGASSVPALAKEYDLLTGRTSRTGQLCRKKYGKYKIATSSFIPTGSRLIEMIFPDWF